MMNSVFKKHAIILASVTILFLTTAFGIWRFEGMMQKKKSRVIEAKEQLASYEENKKIFNEEAKDLAQIAERLAVLDKYRITKNTTPELLSAIEKLALEKGIDFSISSVQTLIAVSKTEKLVIDFTAGGSRDSIDSFLEELSKQTYQVRFTKLSLFNNNPVSTPTEMTLPLVETKPAQIKGANWEVSAGIEIVSL